MMTPQHSDGNGLISLKEWQRERDRKSYEGTDVDIPRLMLWNYRHKLSPEDMRSAIGDIWMFVNDGLAVLPNLPEIKGSTVERLSHDEWLELFDYAGYVQLESFESEGVPCEAPTTLYRYAEHTSQTGLSWTTSLEEALEYDGRFGDELRQGCVWMVTEVEPEQLLAHFHQKTGENEYVFDARYADIEHVQPVHGCPCEQG